jgi:WS/DGAT/MGAT family acyltransferase
MERMSGSDALLWHMEQPGSPMHTLKILVLDPSRRGRRITIDEVIAAVGPRLGLVKRATQKVVAAKGFGGIPFWVDDPDFELRLHVGERTLRAPGTARDLDALYSELAMSPLPRDRALWAMTLVHGLEEGRQAIVVRVHHALTDGLGALNAFLASTSDAAGSVVPVHPADPASPVSDRDLRAEAGRRFRQLVGGAPRLVRDALAGHRKAKVFRATHRDLPPFLGSPRNFCNAASGKDRLCATASLSLDEMKSVAKAAGVTLNGLLHGLLAGAMRVELEARGENTSQPTAAAFAIAANANDRSRRYGNAITPTNVGIFSNLDDPRDRLAHTARSCREGVELRRITGVDMAERWATYGPRLVSLFRRTMADRSPWIVNHLTTGNVAGPSSTRWLGDIEVVDWYSFALALNPANVNVTVHSYAGRMNIGLVTTPEAMPDPDLFLGRVATELELLSTIFGETSSTLMVSTGDALVGSGSANAG